LIEVGLQQSNTIGYALVCLPARHARLIFNALHGMQTRYSDEKALRLSVRLSVCQTREL